MKKGILFYDEDIERYDFTYGAGNYNGGFHCGEELEVKINNKWVFTCFEMDEGWFLVGLPDITISGLYCRIN